MALMIAISKDNIFSLENEYFSYVMGVSAEGILEHLYYGPPLGGSLSGLTFSPRTDRGCTVDFEGVKNYNLNEISQEHPVSGTSDFRFPAFHGVNAEGNSVFVLRYAGYQIVKEKPKIEGLPSARGGESETLILTLKDERHKLEVELYYTVYKDYGVLARSTKFINRSHDDIKLHHVFSAAIHLPPADYEILHLHGTWAREFNAERLTLSKGRFTIDSARGTSSAAHSPFMAIMGKDSTEETGNVYASTLLYSGNFSLTVETGEFGNVRLLAGINPFNFEWQLKPGAQFCTPEALQVFSASGLRGMSHSWHDFIRDKISPPAFRHKPRPSYLNTWEAAYFNVDEAKVLQLADQACAIGVDMLVLDDGWFEGREDSTSSLGDWRADQTRFACGIPTLARKVKAKGLKFGLWIEPEMVNPKSQLFRDHPDWTIHVPGRVPSLGRNQLTLDLSRAEVVDALFSQIDALLSCGEIDYVKWDMNRNMTDVGSAGLGKDLQREVPHRYILGLYRLLEKLTEKYPQVLFENCASGGNRFDLGMLSYMPQGWISDMCDPIGRLEIINSASYLFPLDVTAAYIGPSPNHQNGRITSIETRFHAGAFCAARGVSLSVDDIETYKVPLKKLMHFAKSSAKDMVGGQFDRLIRTDNETAWQYHTADKQRVYLLYFRTLCAPNLPLYLVKMVGLSAKHHYRLQTDDRVYSGAALMGRGLMLPFLADSLSGAGQNPIKADFFSQLFTFERVD